MGTLTTLLLILFVPLIVIAGLIIVIYNRLVTFRQRYKTAFAQVEVQLKRRYDLIPNLVEVAKGYMKHERETLEAVIGARNGAVSAQKALADNPNGAGLMKKLAGAENALGGMMGRLFAVSERYPDLKANANMMQLSTELTTTENKISLARQGYNNVVMEYNTTREVFPNNIIANSFAFLPAELFELDDAEKEAAEKAPDISF